MTLYRKILPAMTERVIFILTFCIFVLNPLSVYAGSSVDDAFQQGIAAYQAKDYTLALKHLRVAADASDIRAQYRLGVMYEYGRGVPKSPEVASIWYDKSAKSGNAQAQYALGTFYLTGNGVVKSKRRAVDLYRQAADQGHAMAQMKLKTLYIDGNRADYRPSQKTNPPNNTNIAHDASNTKPGSHAQGMASLAEMLQDLKNKPTLSKVDAMLLVRQMFSEGSNGGLSQEYRRILNVLTLPSSSSRNVGYRGKNYILPPASPETNRYLGIFTRGQVNYNDMWVADAAGLTDFIDIYMTSPRSRKNIKNFISSKVYKAWQQSTIGNGYKPLRDVIVQLYERIALLPEPEKTNARQLFYDATQAADLYASDLIPNNVYNYICDEVCRNAPRYRLTVN